ncbi:MAG: glycosyltransferase family 2 protein [Ginsengibacter sp.]
MIDIIIINWNSADYLEKCINSIFTTKNDVFVRTIFIIDNNSSDFSVEKIKVNDKIKIIRNKQNLGFAKACNQGFRLSKAPYLLLLNPDTQLLSSTLEDCITCMKENEDIDILGCRLIKENGEVTTSCSRFPTPSRFFFTSIGLSKIFPSIFPPAVLMTGWDHKSSRFVDQVMGAFMFMKQAIFKKIGYFDERFFVYFEELDFSKRLSESGGKTFFNTNISAIHSGEGTTKGVKAYRLFLNLRSRLQYSKKHFSTSGYLLVWIGTFFIEPLSRSFFLIASGKSEELKDLLNGYKLLTGISKDTSMK